MLPFTIKIEVNEEMIQNIINLKDWSWDSIETKITNRALEQATYEMKTSILKEYVSFDYAKHNLKWVITECIDNTLKWYIELYIKKYISNTWWTDELEKIVERMLRNTMESKLTEYTENILSNLMVVNTSQENNQ